LLDDITQTQLQNIYDSTKSGVYKTWGDLQKDIANNLQRLDIVANINYKKSLTIN